jgi:hypothetical protein
MMVVEERDLSVIRSIRQQELVKIWRRGFARRGSCPSYAEFGLSRAEDEMPDLILFRVSHENGEPRFKIELDGDCIAAAWERAASSTTCSECVG